MFVHWLTIILVFIATQVNVFFIILGGVLVLLLALVGKGATGVFGSLFWLGIAFVGWKILQSIGAIQANKQQSGEISMTMRFASATMLIAILVVMFSELVCSTANLYIDISQFPLLKKICDKDVEYTEAKEFDQTIQDVFDFSKRSEASDTTGTKEVPLGDSYEEFETVTQKKCAQQLFTTTRKTFFFGFDTYYTLDWTFLFPDPATSTFQILTKEKLTSLSEFSSWFNTQTEFTQGGTIDYATSRTNIEEMTGRISADVQSFENVPVCFPNYVADAKFKQLLVKFNQYFFDNHLVRIFECNSSVKEADMLNRFQEHFSSESGTKLQIHRCAANVFGFGVCSNDAEKCEMKHVIVKQMKLTFGGFDIFGFGGPTRYAVFSL